MYMYKMLPKLAIFIAEKNRSILHRHVNVIKYNFNVISGHVFHARSCHSGTKVGCYIRGNITLGEVVECFCRGHFCNGAVKLKQDDSVLLMTVLFIIQTLTHI